MRIHKKATKLLLIYKIIILRFALKISKYKLVVESIKFIVISIASGA